MGTALAHVYGPRGAAMKLFRCKDPEVLLSGSAGTGKSRACLEKIHAICLKNQGIRALILRKTAASLTSSGLVTFREKVAFEAMAAGVVRWYGGSRSQAPAFVYDNGSEINVGGLDKATRIMSTEYDIVYVQEATELTEDDWESLTTRLRHGVLSYQQLIADCNPGAPHHWLNRRCTAGRCTMIYCKHEDNPVLYDEDTGQWTEDGLDYLSKLDNLTGVRKLRLRYGKWTAAEGLVYDLFDPEIHLWKPWHRPPDEFPRWLSIDFGYTNPFVCQWWTADPDGRLYMYREIYQTRTLVEDHAARILEMHRKSDGHGGPEPKPLAVICDHDAEDRATLEKHLGWKTVPAWKTVSDGIQAVESRLKTAGDGRPRLYLCRDARPFPDPTLDEAKKPTQTTEEIVEYVWDPRTARDSSGSALGDTLRESPLKENDHGMDAMRYLVAYIDLVGKIKLRWL